VREIVYWIVTAYLIIMLLRVVFSWFPPLRSGTFLASLNSILLDLTEPVLRPVRGIMPSTGMLDFSPLVVLIALGILRGVFAP
jgi:YggT family protein